MSDNALDKAIAKLKADPVSDQLTVDIVAHEKLGNSAEPIAQWFAFGHLPVPLQDVSRHFCGLALVLLDVLPRNAERTVALRKLLESKDAAVRAGISR